MTNQKTVVADAVADAVGVSQWSQLQVSLIQGGAELLCDAAGDQAKGLDQIKDAFAQAFKAGILTFDLWENGRKRYEAAFVIRCDSQAIKPINPTNSANSSWNQTVVPYLKVCQLIKPKSDQKESVSKAEQRAKAETAARDLAAGRNLDEVREAQMTLYKTATAESIAQAKALDKAVEFLEKDVKTDKQARLKVLKESFRKLAAEVAKSEDEAVLADAIVALKRYIKSAV